MHMYIHITTPYGSLCLDLPRYTTGSLMVLQWVYAWLHWRKILWKSCLAEGYTMWHCTIPQDMRTGSQFTTWFCSSKLLVVLECGVYFSLYTYLFTPWCRVLLEKLMGLQLAKKFPAFHGTWRFITALTSLHHLSLSWASPIQSIYPLSLYTGIKNNVFWDVTQQKFTSTSDGSAPSISKFHHITTLLQETKSHSKNGE